MSVSLVSNPFILSTVNVSPSSTEYSSITPVGLSFPAAIDIDTVAVSETNTPSEVVYVNESDPK